MKKILMLLLGTMLVLSMAGVVSAGSDPVTFDQDDFASVDTHTANIEVKLVLEEAYEVTIPADIVLTEHRDGDVLMYSGFNWLNATVHLMNPGEGLVVNITSDQVVHVPGSVSKRWILETSDDDQAEYIIGYTTSPSEHIEESNGITENDQVIAIKDAGKKAELCMHYKLVTPVHELETETYTDTLTFGVYILPVAQVGTMSSTYLKPISA